MRAPLGATLLIRNVMERSDEKYLLFLGWLGVGDCEAIMTQPSDALEALQKALQPTLEAMKHNSATKQDSKTAWSSQPWRERAFHVTTKHRADCPRDRRTVAGGCDVAAQ